MRRTVTLLCVLAWSVPARADDAPYDRYAAFPLVVRHDKHHVRAGLEVGGVLAVGLVDYMLNTTARGGTLKAGESTWGLRYDWPTLHDKLIGTGLNLDSNKFNTNYGGHPFAGTMYYSVARSNHLSFVESYLYAILGSTTWEYFGEIREITSVNDLVTTPVSGASIGEALMQLSGFFQHGDKSFGNDLGAFLASPVNAVNTWADDAEPLRGRRAWHRFVVTGGLGATEQGAAGASHPRARYLDERLSIDLALANLPGYAGAAHESHVWDDGNVSNIRFDWTFSDGKVRDALFATRIVPIGWYWRDATARGGHGVFVGFRMGFEYGMHDWDRDRARSSDLYAFGSPIGIAAEHAFTQGDLTVKTSLDVYGAFTGITSYALFDYERHRTQEGLLTTLRENGYYHALSATFAPAVEIGWRRLKARTELRLDTFRAIEGLDENEPRVDDSITVRDRRFLAKTTFAWEPEPMRFAVEIARAERSGEVGAVSASRSETQVALNVGVVF